MTKEAAFFLGDYRDLSGQAFGIGALRDRETRRFRAALAAIDHCQRVTDFFYLDKGQHRLVVKGAGELYLVNEKNNFASALIQRDNFIGMFVGTFDAAHEFLALHDHSAALLAEQEERLYMNIAAPMPGATGELLQQVRGLCARVRQISPLEQAMWVRVLPLRTVYAMFTP